MYCKRKNKNIITLGIFIFLLLNNDNLISKSNENKWQIGITPVISKGRSSNYFQSIGGVAEFSYKFIRNENFIFSLGAQVGPLFYIYYSRYLINSLIDLKVNLRVNELTFFQIGIGLGTVLNEQTLVACCDNYSGSFPSEDVEIFYFGILANISIGFEIEISEFISLPLIVTYSYSNSKQIAVKPNNIMNTRIVFSRFSFKTGVLFNF